MRRPHRFQEIVTGRHHHRRHRKKEREFERGLTGQSRGLSRGDRAHRARRAGENRGKNLDRADPGRLRQAHLLHAVRPGPCANRIDDPHDHAAQKNGPRHDAKIFEVVADLFFQEPRRDRRNDESNQGQTQGVGQNRAVAPLSARKGGEKCDDAIAEVDRQRQNRSELDHDRIHFPEAVLKIESEERFNNPQMRGGADRKEFRQAFDDAEQKRDQKVIHIRL